MNTNLVTATNTIRSFPSPSVPLQMGWKDGLDDRIQRRGTIDGVAIYTYRDDADEVTLSVILVDTGDRPDGNRVGVWLLPATPTPSQVSSAMGRSPLRVYKPHHGRTGTLSLDEAVSTLVGTHVPSHHELRQTLYHLGVDGSELAAMEAEKLLRVALAAGHLDLADFVRVSKAYGRGGETASASWRHDDRT